MNESNYWIERLNLQKHPEGGHYVSTYRSAEAVEAAALPARYKGKRHLGSSIYFLVTTAHYSAFHRLQTDEIWHFYTGSCLTLHILYPNGRYEKKLMGPNFEQGERFQYVVKAGTWFAAEVVAADAYSLMGCTLAPGFDFDDFELASRQPLTDRYPPHASLIHRLTRS